MLQLEYHCPGGFYRNLSSQSRVNDQEWHSVLVEETDTSVHLSVDSAANASLALPENCWSLRPERDLFLGGLVLLHSFPNVSQGFEGCLDAVMINGEALELLAHGKKVAGMLERRALTQCCLHSDQCSQNPCLNGGKCSQTHGAGKARADPEAYPRRLCRGPCQVELAIVYHHRVYQADSSTTVLCGRERGWGAEKRAIKAPFYCSGNHWAT